MMEDVKNKAKETQNIIAHKITELTEAGTGKLKNAFTELSETSVGKIKEIVNAAADAGAEKIKETLESINEIIPVLTALGYKVTKMKIGMSVTPDLYIEISGLSKAMDEAQFQRTLEEKKNHKILTAILYALQKAKQMQSKVQIAGMKYDVVEIVLGLPPKINAVFVRTQP